MGSGIKVSQSSPSHHRLATQQIRKSNTLDHCAVRNMRCPYCGSNNIVWDYVRGDVICASCGTVLERIYVTEQHISQELMQEPARTRTHKRHGSRRVTITKYTSEYLKLIDKVKRSKRLKNIVIDSEQLRRYVDGEGPPVKIFKRNPQNVQMLLKDPKVRLILEVMLRFPRLSSRTDRAKVALALMALMLLTGRRINAKEVAEKSGISTMHARRLAKTLEENREFMEELKKVIEQ